MLTAQSLQDSLAKLRDLQTNKPAPTGILNYQDFQPAQIGTQLPDTSQYSTGLVQIQDMGSNATAIEQQKAQNQRAYDLMQQRQAQLDRLRQQYQGQVQGQPQPLPNSPGAGAYQHGVTQWTPDWRQNVVQFARKQLGIPYVWGGESRAGFDCSGLTQYVYAHMGLQLPRVSADQGRMGHAVKDLTTLRPGDLVLWDNSSRNNGADHVAIYIGNGMVIEAPRPGLAVQVSPLYDTGEAWGIRIHLAPKRQGQGRTHRK